MVTGEGGLIGLRRGGVLGLWDKRGHGDFSSKGGGPRGLSCCTLKVLGDC